MANKKLRDPENLSGKWFMIPWLIRSSMTQRTWVVSGLPRFAFDNVDDGLEEGEREVGVTGSRVQKEEQRALVDVTDLEQKK